VSDEHSRARVPKVPSFTDALCSSSRKLRQRSLPPPPPVAHFELSRPRPRRGERPFPLPEPRVVASDYYRRYIKSVYEKEPFFEEFASSLPPSRQNFYDKDTLAGIKKDFDELIDDGLGTAATAAAEAEATAINTQSPWRSPQEYRDPLPASERLARVQAARPRDPPHAFLPKLRVYHKSTWMKND
jgi:hypothetical protein